MRRVDPKVYTKEYYLTDCTGHEIFKKSYGSDLDITFKEMIKYFDVRPGMAVLDIGCGRGELVFYAASKGAKVVGIDYAKASIDLAKIARNKQSKKIQKLTRFELMDAKKLKFAKSSFDLIIMTGVVEHLYPEELEASFSEIKRVLKQNGKILIHTAPNKLFNDYTYKNYCYAVSTFLTSVWNGLTNSKYPNLAKPEKIRKHSHAIMHINEPTYFSLKNLYNKFNLVGSIQSTNITVIKQPIGIKDKIFNAFVFLHPLSKYFPLNIFFGSDFISLLSLRK